MRFSNNDDLSFDSRAMIKKNCVISKKFKKGIEKMTTAGKVIMVSLFLLKCMLPYAQDAIPSPPAGFDAFQSNIVHGTTEVVSYYSSTVGINRNTRIYLPPDYNRDSAYNILYLLHGIGGDINEWYNFGAPHYILDNLFAEDKIAPMIVVLPNGRAMVDDSPGSDIFAPDKVAGFANFEFELIKDLIPFIDTTYSVKPGREARAIAGLSMGGGQALNFGLGHLDTFAWIGAFSAAPNTKAANLLIPNLSEDTSKISALWLSCGSADGLLYITQNTHNFLVQNNFDHYYLIEQGKGHDWSVWKPGLYHFTQRIFGRVPEAPATTDIHSNKNPDPFVPQYHNELNFRLVYNSLEQTITFYGTRIIKQACIYDLNGRLRYSESNIVSNTLKADFLIKGVYLMVLYDNKRCLHEKFIKY